MLLTHKYCPKNFKDAHLNKNILEKLKNISNIESFQSLLIYGGNGNGKYTISQLILQSLYGDDIYNKKHLLFDVKVNGTLKQLDIVKSNYHFELYFNDNYNYDNNIICEFLKEISKSYNVINKSYKLVVLRNVQYMSQQLYNTLKNIFEKYYNNIKFIMICDTINNIPRYIFGFLFLVKIPYLKGQKEILVEHINKICKKENISMTSEKLNKLLTKYNYNLNIIYSMIELIKQNKNYNLIDPIEQRFKKIVKLIEKKSVFEIDNIRKELYDLTSTNINKIEFILYIFNHFHEKTSKKIELVSFTNDILTKIKKSYRELFHLEYYIINMLDFTE
tara:strand:- start:10782 stop:11780 length:999 start_codon:yes stop_codon:yes gene_type:complete